MALRYFADTFYFLAILSPTDAAHTAAVGLSGSLDGEMVTTDAVLLEVADALSAPGDRETTATYIHRLWEHPKVEVVSTDRPLMLRGLQLYASRADKSWGLTDCISFVVMEEQGIGQALTGDLHFQQAGFKILFPGR